MQSINLYNDLTVRGICYIPELTWSLNPFKNSDEAIIYVKPEIRSSKIKDNGMIFYTTFVACTWEARLELPALMLQAKYLKYIIEMSSSEMLIPFQFALASVKRLCLCLCHLVFTCYSHLGLGTLPQWCSQSPRPLPLRSEQPVAHPHLRVEKL